MRLLLLLLLAFAIAITNALIQDIECNGLHKACCDGEDLPGTERNPGDVGDGAKTGCTTFGRNKKECANRKNMACCAAFHGDIGTQCKDVPDEQVTCPEPALAYRKHKRWSLPLKRALFQKRGDWCDERGAAQQFRDSAEKNPPKPELDNGFPAINTGAAGGALNFINELSKSDDKETKTYPFNNVTPIDPATANFAPDFAPLQAYPADGVFDYTSDPYFQQDF